MKKKTIQLIDFFRTGHLGPIHLGMSLQEVVVQLGAPTEQYQLKNGFLLAYGGWEILFKQEKPHLAFLIQHSELLYDCTNHDEVIRFESDLFGLDTGIIQPFQHVRLHNMKDWLDQEKIAYHIERKERQPLMKLNSGIFIDFLDVEPVIRIENKEIPVTKIEKMDDFILYTIGILNERPFQ